MIAPLYATSSLPPAAPAAPAAQQSLVLPHQHALSLALCEQVVALSADLPAGVQSCKVVAPGLVELQLLAGSARGYGARPWPLRIGGEGQGADSFSMDAELNLTAPAFCAPVAVRFAAVPLMVLHGVDDTGFVGEEYWTWDSAGAREDGGAGEGACQGGSGQGGGAGAFAREPSLRALAERATVLLREGGLEGATATAAAAAGSAGADARDDGYSRARAAWLQTEAQMFGKLSVIETYRAMAATPALVDPVGALHDDWLVPSIRRLLAAPLAATATAAGAAEQTAAAEQAAAAAQADGWRALATESPPGSGIFTLDMFTHTFCDAMVRESLTDL